MTASAPPMSPFAAASFDRAVPDAINATCKTRQALSLPTTWFVLGEIYTFPRQILSKTTFPFTISGKELREVTGSTYPLPIGNENARLLVLALSVPTNITRVIVNQIPRVVKLNLPPHLDGSIGGSYGVNAVHEPVVPLHHVLGELLCHHLGRARPPSAGNPARANMEIHASGLV